MKEPSDEQLEGCEHEQTEPHTCPFAEEIEHDSSTLCTCCVYCEQKCGFEI